MWTGWRATTNQLGDGARWTGIGGLVVGRRVALWNDAFIGILHAVNTLTLSTVLYLAILPDPLCGLVAIDPIFFFLVTAVLPCKGLKTLQGASIHAEV